MDEYKPRLSSKEEKYKLKVQSLIEHCSYCQPYDGGDVVWIHGERTELDELFYKCGVPEEYWDKIMQHLCCPFCGNSSFDLGSDVGLKTEFDKEVDKHIDEANQLYGREVEKLEDLLESYPLLAFQNSLAKRIYKEIKEKKLPIASVRGKFYRARKVESSEVISSKGMYNPPLGKSSEGRFNHSGQSHLYLANNKNTAMMEVSSEGGPLLIWCQEFEILDDVNDILDLSFDWDKLTPSTSTLLLSLKVHNSIGRTDRNCENWKPDYYLTRYIMDCAKSLGFKGIKYNSVKYLFSYDLVLFYPEKENIKPIGNPCVEVFLDKDGREKFFKNY